MKKIRLKLKFNQEIKLKNILEYFENVAFFKKDKIWILGIFFFSEIEEIIAKTHQVGGAVLVDGAQASPHIKADVQALDVDFYVVSGHKMCGPTGVGMLYGKEAWLEKLPPYQGGGEMIDQVTFEKTTYAGLPHKFEAGTPPIAAGVGFGVSIDYLNTIGMEIMLRSWEFS